jgi:hypothetical protein
MIGGLKDAKYQFGQSEAELNALAARTEAEEESAGSADYSRLVGRVGYHLLKLQVVQAAVGCTSEHILEVALRAFKDA